MNRKLLFLMAFFAFFGITTLAQPQWVGFTKEDPAHPIFTLNTSNNNEVNFSVEVCGMYDEIIIEGDTEYNRINIPGAYSLDST